MSPWGLRRALEHLEHLERQHAESIHALQEQLALMDNRVAESERRLDTAESAIRGIQQELEQRDQRLAGVDRRFDELESVLAAASAVADRTRDELIPAVVDRGNLLIDRLARDLDEVASLVERVLRSEPLPVPDDGPEERELAAALRTVQPRLIDELRGSEDEIRHRLEPYLALLRGSEPVLDLGCGRGELLGLLREAGVEAFGVEGDPALAQAARRRGLEVEESDVLGSLRGRPSDSAGAVAAVHLLEHLHPAIILQLLGEIRRVLRPGGLLIAECPNPHSLRVGAGDYWLDPTHVRPLPPRLLELFAVASGLAVERVEFLRPYPEEQRLAAVAGPDGLERASQDASASGRLDRLVERLDELLNGPRDYLLVARRPASD